MSFKIKIRSELSTDLAAIEALTLAAFKDIEQSDHTEQLIVNALRNAGQLSISLVAELEGKIVGHVAVSPIIISDGSNRWYGLGPISVAPECQRKGIGSLLMEQGLMTLKNQSASGCVVLGDPKYYSRFGFKVEANLIFPGVPQEYFQAISFNSKIPTGIVKYHEAFDSQG